MNMVSLREEIKGRIRKRTERDFLTNVVESIGLERKGKQDKGKTKDL